jgi:hypothetical protein
MSAEHENEHQGQGQEKEFHIVVNGRKRTVPEEKVTYEQLVLLAFGEIKPNTTYTITYSKGPKENREGNMSPGDKVVVKNEMVFNVTPSDKS